MRTYTLLAQCGAFCYYLFPMAIYHFTAKTLSRTQGKSAVGAAAYRRATSLYDERLEKTWNYTNKPNVVHSELLIPTDSPEWLQTLAQSQHENPDTVAQTFWNLVEQHEKRDDAQLAREIEFALPIELDQEQGIALAKAFVMEQCVSLGMVADLSVHWDDGNPHVHVMLTMRGLTETGFGLKRRDWNQKNLLKTWREQWAEYVNFHLAMHQHDVKIDHRSYRELGIDLIPTIHQGKATRDMAARGIVTDIMRQSAVIQAQNLQIIQQQPGALLAKISYQQSTFTLKTVAHELSRYAVSYDLSALLGGAAFDQKTSFSSASDSRSSQSVDNSLSLDKSDVRYDSLRSIFSQDTTGLVVDNEVHQRLLTDDVIAQLLHDIEQHESVISEADIARVLAKRFSNAQDFARALVEIKGCADLLPIGVGEDGRERYTTKAMFHCENQLQVLADKLVSRKTAAISQKRLNALLTGYEQKVGKTLTDEQRAMIAHVMRPVSLACVVGRAGTGKSFSLGAAHAIWQAQGFTVHGVALSGIAADGLSKDAGIASQTIEGFLRALEKDRLVLDAKSVVVMDEAGMTDSVSLQKLLTHVNAAGAKLVLVGDPDQLQPVGPGASLRALIERIGFAELVTVYRQVEAWQRQATEELSAGQIAMALRRYRRRDSVHLLKDEAQARARLVADWQAKRLETGADIRQLMVIAHRNEDVQAFNQQLRQVRVDNQELMAGYSVKTALGTMAIAQGERLLFLKNDRRLGVNNGRFATVTQVEVSEAGQVLRITVQLDGAEGQMVTFSPAQYQQFTYGYAATVHKLQGVTHDHSFVYAQGYGWDKYLTYVAMTRHRLSCQLYAAKTSYETLEQLVKQLGKLRIKDSLLNYPLAFAQRRGCVMSHHYPLLITQLAGKLQTAKTQLFDNLYALLRPEQYWQQKTQQAQKAEQVEAIYQRREDAKVVAAYVNANRVYGQAWQALEAELRRLGVKGLDRKQPSFRVVAQSVVYQAFVSAAHARNDLAAQLLVEPTRYQKALAIYGIAPDKLAQQARAYQAKIQVNAYLAETNPEQKEALAATIYAEIKSHYVALQDAEVDSKALRLAAKAHHRRVLLASLTIDEQAAFERVAEYQAATQAFAQALTAKRQDEANHLGKTRDALAYQLLENVDLHAAGLDFYGIGRANPQDTFGDAPSRSVKRWYQLQQQARRHAWYTWVPRYQTAINVHDVTARNQLAYDLLQEAWGRYREFETLGLDAKRLRKHAQLHLRAELLAGLGKQARADFLTVERQCFVKQAIAKALSDSVVKQERLTRLLRERDRLAHQITEMPERYELGLDFYEIGSVREGNTYPVAAAQALKRWARLHQHAYRHAWYEDISRYQQLAKQGATLLRDQLAAKILREAQGRYRELPGIGLKSELLREQAKHHQRRVCLLKEPTLRSSFLTVERYRYLSKRLGELWHAKTFNPLIHQRLVTERDSLAAQIIKQGSRYQPALDFYEIGQAQSDNTFKDATVYAEQRLSRLQQQAQAHQHRSDVAWYQTMDEVLWRSELAYELTQDGKTYHRFIKEAGLNWKPIYQDARIAERQALFEQVTLEEKRLLRLAYRYQQVNRQTARAWQTALRHQGTKTAVSKKRFTAAQGLAAKRDYLAGQLVQAMETVTWQVALEGRDSLALHALSRLKLEKLHHQAHTHQARFAQVHAWQVAVQAASGSFNTLTDTNRMLDSALLIEAIQEAGQTLRKNWVPYQPALQQAGVTAKQVLRWQAGAASLMACLTVLGHPEPTIDVATGFTAEQQEKAQKAQWLVRGTQALQGTLAERYLREHRGITGAIHPDTFCFHPNLRNWMTGSTHPALIVVARDSHGKVCGLQAIFLDPLTANKAALGGHTKLSRGLIGEGALVQAGLPGGKVALAEGPETALSVAAAHPDWSVWVTFGVGNFTKVARKAKVPAVVICADNDGPQSGTARAVARAAEVLSKAGIDVSVAEPQKPANQKKWDFNDALLNAGIQTVREDLDKAPLVKAGITPERVHAQLQETLASLIPVSSQKEETKSTVVDTTPEPVASIRYPIYSEAWMNQATDEIKRGNLAGALSTYAFKHCVHSAYQQSALMQQLVAHWQQAHVKDPQRTQLIVTGTAALAETINQAAAHTRQALLPLEATKHFTTQTGEITLHIDGPLHFMLVAQESGMLERQTGTVLGFDNDSLTIAVAGKEEPLVLTTAQVAEFNLKHHYAVSVDEAIDLSADDTDLYPI